MKVRTIESPIGPEIAVDGRKYINFAGSSYLGLAAKEEIIQGGIAELRQLGSRYQLPMHYQLASRAHQEVEEEAALFFGTQAAMYLAGGYYFGIVVVPSMRNEVGAIFYDECAHYSLLDGIRISGLRSYAYRHLDAGDLEDKLKQYLRPSEKPLVVTDGLYSTLGEIAPLEELAKAMTPYSGRLVVDESHSFGVLGARGRGACEHHNLSLLSVTFGGSTGKALGVSGGIALANELEVAAFRGTPAGRGAAAGMPAAASMCAASLRYVRHHPDLLDRLRENTAYAKRGFRRIGLEVGDSVAPVVAFKAGTRESMVMLQERLMLEGIFVQHSSYIGAGPAGVIRCCIFADHTRHHIDYLLDCLARML